MTEKYIDTSSHLHEFDRLPARDYVKKCICQLLISNDYISNMGTGLLSFCVKDVIIIFNPIEIHLFEARAKIATFSWAAIPSLSSVASFNKVDQVGSRDIEHSWFLSFLIAISSIILRKY